MRCQFIMPPAVLRNYIRYFWTLDFDTFDNQPKMLKVFADRYPRLIFQYLDGHSAIRQLHGASLPPSFLSGVVTERFTYQVESGYSHTGVSFYPHGLKPFFRLDAHQLVNEGPDLLHFCPPGLIDKLNRAGSHLEHIHILIGFLVGQLARYYQEDWLMNEYMLEEATGQTAASVYALMKKFRLSERQLERKFKAAIGISPVTYLRIGRFEQALRQISAGDFVHLSDVAYGLDYADHSHFTREFKAFSGYTPKDFLAAIKPVQDVEESSSFLTDEALALA